VAVAAVVDRVVVDVADLARTTVTPVLLSGEQKICIPK
jgi:hypothetical protein